MYVGIFGIEGGEEEGGITLLAAEGGQKKSTLTPTSKYQSVASRLSNAVQ